MKNIISRNCRKFKMPILALSFALIYINVFLTLPMLFLSSEDDVSGLTGYTSQFLIYSIFSLTVFAAFSVLIYKICWRLFREYTVVIVCIIAAITIVNTIAEWPSYGVLDNFVFSEAVTVSAKGAVFDLIKIVTVSLIVLYALYARPNLVVVGLIVCSLSALIFFGVSVKTFEDKVSNTYAKDTSDIEPIAYSRKSKNIVVFVMDGAMSGYIPYIFDSHPKFHSQYDGFTLYPNAVSTGDRTINTMAAVFGGHEYTVSNINERSSGSLLEKVSEAYEVLPSNFLKRGYRVTYLDPFWYGFKRRGDCPRIIKTLGMACINFIDSVGRQKANSVLDASFSERVFPSIYQQYIALSIFKSSPSIAKPLIYSDRDWLGFSAQWKKKQDKYLMNYMALDSLSEYSSIDEGEGTLTFIVNNITRATVLSDSNCMPDNTLQPDHFDLEKFKDRETVEILVTTKCALFAYGKYLDWFKKNDIYDNSEFYIVSDHGWKSFNPAFEGEEHQHEKSKYQSLMMIKNVGEKGKLKEDNDFIVNADLPALVCRSIDGCESFISDSKIRPLAVGEKVKLHSTPWNPAGQDEMRFELNSVHEVERNIFDKDNWRISND
ncbi:hypothetical protein [Microbulbifer sp.]|uniref:hypothetical protein n=1 Tax=Microbulbifer sp. TaxID=1908541 RepID=UPI00258B8807|nr:hypothetical protein [Microbulbifer sp.]